DVTRWDSALQKAVPSSDYKKAASDRRELGRWLAATRRYGFALMTGVPAMSGSLCKVVELFGFVRETNYGRWFEVRAEVNPNNLAYTNLSLHAHTGTPHRAHGPTLPRV